MGFISKIKALFVIQKPLGEVIAEVKDVKQTKKWFHFAVTLLGTLGTTALALKGVIPPEVQIVASSVLQSLYNILRGADKADVSDVKGTFRTTEFWLTALTEIQKAFVAVQAGGVSPGWMVTASGLVATALAAGQNLAARVPTTELDK